MFSMRGSCVNRIVPVDSLRDFDLGWLDRAPAPR